MAKHIEQDSTRYAAFYGDEVIVALPHLPQLASVLDLAGVPWKEKARSTALDLARLELPDVEGAAEAVWRFATDAGAQVPRSGSQRPVDRLLAALRAFFAHRHAGWTPTLGKNRLAGGVSGGGGSISHGGGGRPRPESGRLPKRGAGPGRGVRVAVLDTGIAPQPWLGGGWEAAYSDRLPRADLYTEVAGHGTFVTGLVLSQAPAATVTIRTVLRPDRSGEYVADCWTVATAIAELATAGIDVLNLSLVCYTEDGQPPLLLSTAVATLPAGTVVVAAAGNHGNLEHADPDERSKPVWPAALDGVIAVGAAAEDSTDPAPFTPPNKFWIDLLAAGEGLVSTYLTGEVQLDDKRTRHFRGLARWSGSSFSAALVSGAIAAGVQPGRVTAAQSLRDILATAVGDPTTGLPHEYTPPFLPLDLPQLR